MCYLKNGIFTLFSGSLPFKLKKFCMIVANFPDWEEGVFTFKLLMNI